MTVKDFDQAIVGEGITPFIWSGKPEKITGIDTLKYGHLHDSWSRPPD
jgi:hypothetical protein